MSGSGDTFRLCVVVGVQFVGSRPTRRGPCSDADDLSSKAHSTLTSPEEGEDWGLHSLGRSFGREGQGPSRCILLPQLAWRRHRQDSGSV
ncbi:hypothetical protein NDU88_003463 [Pleurodeles waltl]|uniref:Uncharacterized protein n=1 Tax=Pleurodeles waltl TaxID=8319 RepID=A0AAV7RIA3_PLEWA|nr:hypothetical protein NDU88_003463 [Pleurodeles waltl]